MNGAAVRTARASVRSGVAPAWAIFIGIFAFSAALAAAAPAAARDRWLIFAAATLALTGVAHSVLGERYVLRRLLERVPLPSLLGSEAGMRRTLRFAWHLTSVAWWALAALLVGLTTSIPRDQLTLAVIGSSAAVSALVAAIASRGRHMAWAAFSLAAAAIWLAAR